MDEEEVEADSKVKRWKKKIAERQGVKADSKEVFGKTTTTTTERVEGESWTAMNFDADPIIFPSRKKKSSKIN